MDLSLIVVAPASADFRPGWGQHDCCLARALLAAAPRCDIGSVQRRVLIPLELELISRSSPARADHVTPSRRRGAGMTIVDHVPVHPGHRPGAPTTLLLEHVTRSDKVGDGTVTAFRDVGLAVDAGEFAVVLGPSGSG